MTPEQVKYCARVALYTKFLAVRLMNAGESGPDLGSLFLDLFHGEAFREESLSSAQDAEDLMVLVESGCDPHWQYLRLCQEHLPDSSRRVCIHSALLDLTKSAWLWRVVRRLEYGFPADAAEAATRFLFLRERIHAFVKPLRIHRNDGERLVQALCQFVFQRNKQRERTYYHAKPPDRLNYQRAKPRLRRRRGLGL